ncbi:MAG: hypothetical protein AMXMBFR58_05920 [Phycisphaerae bacterium]
MPSAFSTQPAFEFRPPLADADLALTGDVPVPFFNPHDKDQVIADLADPHHSLLSIAAKHGTTLEALNLWMTRADVADSLANLQSAAVTKARLTASIQLPRAVPLLLTLLASSQQEETKLPLTDSLRSLHTRARLRTISLRAAHCLLRIASYHTPRPAPARATGNSPPNSPPDTPTPRAPGGLSASAPSDTPVTRTTGNSSISAPSDTPIAGESSRSSSELCHLNFELSSGATGGSSASAPSDTPIAGESSRSSSEPCHLNSELSSGATGGSSASALSHDPSQPQLVRQCACNSPADQRTGFSAPSAFSAANSSATPIRGP